MYCITDLEVDGTPLSCGYLQCFCFKRPPLIKHKKSPIVILVYLVRVVFQNLELCTKRYELKHQKLSLTLNLVSPIAAQTPRLLSCLETISAIFEIRQTT